MPGLLITGASGYIGGRVVEAARGKQGLHALWRTTQPPEGGTHHQVELDDGPAVDGVMRAARPDVVLHAAYSPTAPPEPNLRWSRNVTAAARAVGARVVLVSTDLVFDGTRGWYREDEPTRPVLPYGAWKAELEREVLAEGGIVARTSLVWGLEPLAESVGRLVVEPLRAGQTPRLFEDEWRTPTEVHDLAESLLLACALPGPRILHLAGPERISRLDLGRLIARHFGFDPALLPPYNRAEVAPNRPADTSLSCEASALLIPTRFRGPSEVLG